MANKFHQLVHVIKSIKDVFILSKIKLDKTFSPMKYHIEGYGLPFKPGHNNYGGGVMT